MLVRLISINPPRRPGLVTVPHESTQQAFSPSIQKQHAFPALVDARRYQLAEAKIKLSSFTVSTGLTR